MKLNFPIIIFLLILSILINIIQYCNPSCAHDIDQISNAKKQAMDSIQSELTNYKALYEVAKDVFKKDTCFHLN
jgi:hypothetical protein